MADSRTLRVEELVAELSAAPLMREAVFHSVRFQDGKVEKEVCDVLLLHEQGAILLSVKAQERRRDASATKKWAQKHAPKAVGQLRGAYRTFSKRSTWCQHPTFGRRAFDAGSIVPHHGVGLVESDFEVVLGIDESCLRDASRITPTSLMSLKDFAHVVRYLRTWNDLRLYLQSRHASLKFPDSATLGAESALLGYYTAMRDGFHGCTGISDAKIVTARGEHVRSGSAFREKEVLLSQPLEDLMRNMSAAGEMLLPEELGGLQSSVANTLLDRDTVREQLSGLTIQERAALGEQICWLCKRTMEEDPTQPLYAGVRFGRHPNDAYVVVVARDPDQANLNAHALDLAIAACVYHERRRGTAIVLNQVGADLKFSISRIDNVTPSVEMMTMGQQYFGHIKPRKIEWAR